MTEYPVDVCSSGTHAVQFCKDDAALEEALATFVGTALAIGAPVVVIATASHRKQLAVKLEQRMFSVQQAVDAGMLTLIDARWLLDELTVDGELDRDRFQSIVGALLEHRAALFERPLRVFGEMVDLLWQLGQRQDVLALEGMWNEMGQAHKFHLLCAYIVGPDAERDDHEFLERVCQTHTHVVTTRPSATIEQAEIGALMHRARAMETELQYRRKLEQALRETLTERLRAQEVMRQIDLERSGLLEREHEARRLAESSNRAKDEFFAMLGHELRNPLAPMVTAVQVARMRGESSRELDVMERQLQHLVRLVDDLLDISKITSGTIPLRCERLEIFDVVYRSIDKISPLLDAGRHVLSLDVPRTGCAVRGDYARLIQSVANLLSNACKYSEPQGEITVTARRQGSKVILSVSDRGAGIEPAFLERIFEPFVQRPQANDRSHGGLGLGLAITRSLIQRHGGEIRVTSDGPGHGSTFEIDLPAFAGAEDGEEERFSGAGQVTDAPPRVLVVDDNEDAADLMAHLLGSIGFDVRVAYDGPSALELADEFQPQVGLLDIGLPVMDGYELAMRLRARRKSEPLSLIAISGYGQEADRVKSRQAGFITHLLKPVEISSVKNLLFETLQCAQPPCPPRSKSPAA